MFCHKCGASLPDGATVCPDCQTILSSNKYSDMEMRAQKPTRDTDDHFESAMRGSVHDGPHFGSPLSTNRDILILIALSLITCGVYHYLFVNSLANDVNVACEGDGGETPGGLVYFLLTVFTCGIYSLIWWYSVSERLKRNASRYRVNYVEDSTTVLLMLLLGGITCGICTVVGMHYVLRSANTICAAYNREHGMA